MEDIKKAKLISVASAEDDNLMTKGTVVICENVVTGSVDEMEILTDLSGKVTVADNPYYYYITKNLTSADFLDYGIAAGDTGKFYTNAMGDIVYKDIKSSLSTNYALLMGIAKKQDITDECEIKLFDATGEIKLFSVADRLIFRDGTSDTQKITLRDKKIAQQLLGTADNISNLRPITYKLNQDNQICELSYSYPNIDKKPMKQVFTMDRQFNKPDSSNKASYNKYNKSIGDLYLKDDTVIFSINNITADDYIANKSYSFNDEDISIVDMNDIPAKYQEYCEGFSIQDGNEINMMVMLNVQQQKEILPYFSIVKSTSEAINKAGDVTTKLVCLENGNEIEYFLTADCNIAYDNTYFKGSFSNDKGIEANDLIAYEKGAGGEIRKLRIIMRTNAVCNYLPDIYSETREAANVEELNIKLPISTSIIGEQIDYYFGLVTAKYQGNKTNKITLTVNDDKIIVRDPIDNGDFSYDQKSRMTVTLPLSDELPILRFEANMKNKLQKISFSDIAADAIKGDERTGDLAFVKTVNGSITEIYLIGI